MLTKSLSSKIAIVVVSTDSFSDSWPIFFRQLNKFWNESLFAKYLITDSLYFQWDGVKTIHPEKGSYIDNMDWGGRLSSCLKKISEEYIILLFEDYILIKNVDHFEVQNAFNFVINNNIDFLSLGTHDFRRKGHFNVLDRFVKVKSFTKYRVTTSPGIWRKQALDKYLLKGLNPWQFEILGSIASVIRRDKFFMLNIFYYNLSKEIIPYFIDNGLDSAIVRGKWQKSITQYLDSDQIDQIQKRGFLDKYEINKFDTVKKVFRDPYFVLKYILVVLFR
jgi:hypothetical protein